MEPHYSLGRYYIGTPNVGIQQMIMDAIANWHRAFVFRFPDPRALRVCYQIPYKEFAVEQEERLRKVRIKQRTKRAEKFKEQHKHNVDSQKNTRKKGLFDD